MTREGFRDAWRTVYPNEMEKPGDTWTPMMTAEAPNPQTMTALISSISRVKNLS